MAQNGTVIGELSTDREHSERVTVAVLLARGAATCGRR
jgi:hypothetical protein